MAEYKLSYTGAQIDAKLKKIDTLAEKSEIPTKTSDLTNDSGYITSLDIPVKSINGKTGDVNLVASDVGALPDTTVIPTKVSDLNNDSGFITSYTETDPTVPSWAKASTKPTYTKSEVGLGNVDNVKQYSASNPPPYPVTSVNGNTGAITVSAVPNCTTSNNGQFLRVVNGVATWSTVPNAEEATF